MLVKDHEVGATKLSLVSRNAVGWYRKSYKQESRNRDGVGVEKEALKAVYWLCCNNGRGFKRDGEHSVRFYRKAANLGNAGAQCNLWWCYGLSVEKDM
ncbi:hypothetical protein BJ742DRAFT_810529 [Cladochytrium replicatum]|nr:hypothetical protein BJ742DRAFT_810529 [Cladochytrium replicatum]